MKRLEGILLTRSQLRKFLLKVFSFDEQQEQLKEASKIIKDFIQNQLPKQEEPEIVDQKPTTSCNHVVIDQKLQLASRIQLENDYMPGKSLCWNPDHTLIDCQVKILLRVTTEHIKPSQLEEEERHKDFKFSYTKLKEDNKQVKEEKSLEWMEAEIKTKEVDISIDSIPKLAEIGDYWTEEKTAEIINILKEYQDLFARDYIDLKGLVQEMGHMKIELLPDTKPIKKRPYKLAH